MSTDLPKIISIMDQWSEFLQIIIFLRNTFTLFFFLEMNAKRTTIEQLQEELTQGILENGHVIINGTISRFNIDMDKSIEKALKVTW
jgi:hypothetical protein